MVLNAFLRPLFPFVKNSFVVLKDRKDHLKSSPEQEFKKERVTKSLDLSLDWAGLQLAFKAESKANAMSEGISCESSFDHSF